MNKKGFTLIELLIVISIIGILAAVAIPIYAGVTKKAERSKAYANLESLALLMQGFYADRNSYPPSAGDTAAVRALHRAFNPELGSIYDYSIINSTGAGLPTPVAVPYDGATAALPDPNAPCFIAVATGIAGTRVDGDVFAIDCNNNKNY